MIVQAYQQTRREMAVAMEAGGDDASALEGLMRRLNSEEFKLIAAVGEELGQVLNHFRGIESWTKVSRSR